MYSISGITKDLTTTLHQYLEADYHIWDESLIRARRNLFEQQNLTSSDPRLEASPTFLAGVPFSKMDIPNASAELLSNLSKINGSGVYPEPRAHQRNALEAFLGRNQEIIVATGTGSGKTESFLYPILGSLANESQRGKNVVSKHGCRVILLYPMNALVNDQLTRLRKMLGNKDVAEQIKSVRGKRATFGVYTSKTDYPGKRSDSRDKKLIERLKDLYQGPAEEKKNDLWNEGLWPAKDMGTYLDLGLETTKDDSELFTRHEIQSAPPDILITNYSMLEYMLARPIERDIFDKTAEWLLSHEDNYLTIVLDEAHMYRGVVGAEVALLLRRLQSRLGVSRDKIKFILTSASLGSTEEDKRKAIKFACDLTGKVNSNDAFRLITSEIEKKHGEALPTQAQIHSLAKFDIKKLHDVHNSLSEAVEEVSGLFESLKLGYLPESIDSQEDLKDAIYRKLDIFPPAAYLANRLTSKPTSYEGIKKEMLGNVELPGALEALFALCTFAQLKANQQVYLPIRLHLMYRGIPGLYACINPNCSEKHEPDTRTLLGKIYTHPVINCKCGGRVFEVLTHRDCGAAFIRGYISESSPDFLLDQQALGVSGERLLETHFLLETERSIHAKNLGYKYIHKFTGRMVGSNPDSEEYICVGVSDQSSVELGNGKYGWSFANECPVCSRTWRQGTKIQDLATKGEAPFSYLVRAQVAGQPATKKITKKMPLGGRKTLVFSDGRQKAARLARDIPRNVEKDVFRITLVLAIDKLQRLYGAPTLNPSLIYISFLLVLLEKNILLFDGDSRATLISDLKRAQEFVDEAEADGADHPIREMLDDATWEPPSAFSELLLVNLCSTYYSFSSLTLGYVCPTKRALKQFQEKIAKLGLDEKDAVGISVNWLTRILESGFAFNKAIPSGVRVSAAGYMRGFDDWGVAKGNRSFYKNFDFISKDQSLEIEEALLSSYCTDDRNKFFIDPSKVKINLNLSGSWYQCLSCTKLSMELIRGYCPHCGSKEHKILDPDTSQYLRARKSFYRDPVLKALNGEPIFNLVVEEHTAQLSYRDEEDHVSTNEYYERKFKDILINDNDMPVDILSCTTTMEVGVDIGSLIAVSMRNVPPARQNYQQRAGRAGRRGAAISTVLTFAQTGSHDSYYFENPDYIISGEPIVPDIDIGNVKVIFRHVVAAIIQSFFHRLNIDKSTGDNNLLSVLGLTRNFYEGQDDFNFNSLKSWIEDEFMVSGINLAIQKWLPDSGLDVENITEELLIRLEECRPSNFDDAKSYEEKFLNFLFSCDLLPSYAFPRHVCSFQIEGKRNDPFSKIEILENPQQGLATALSEYAPGRFVVVNKKTYKIGTIAAKSGSTEKNRAKPLFEKKRQYLQCQNCMFTEDYSPSSPNISGCTHCGAASVKILDVIQPEVVYPNNRKEINEFLDDDTFTTPSSAQLPFISSSNPPWRVFKGDVKVVSQSNEELVTINKGEVDKGDDLGFWVCKLCGKASPEKDKPEVPHERDYHVFKLPDNPRNKCHGDFEKVNIGYSFNSDVFIMRLPLNKPMLQIGSGILKDGLITAARTLSEALLQEASIKLQIDPSEMSCGTRFLKISGINYLDIFIYDTAAGGAGYAKMTGDNIGLIFADSVKQLVKDCCTTSCYRCLQHYGNRWHHSNIDKQYGLMLWKFIQEAKLPELYNESEQYQKSFGLIHLLKLEGWQIQQGGYGGLLVEKDGRTIRVVIYPVLLDPDYVKNQYDLVDVCVSDYEVQRNLPGAYSRIVAAN